MQDALGYADSTEATAAGTTYRAVHVLLRTTLHPDVQLFAVHRKKTEEAFEPVTCCKHKKSGEPV